MTTSFMLVLGFVLSRVPRWRMRMPTYGASPRPGVQNG